MIKYIFLSSLVALSFGEKQSTEVQEFLSGNVKFSAAVYKELIKVEQRNFIVSPFSLEVVLALTNAGAKGLASQEIIKGLILPSTQEKTEKAFKELLPSINTDNDKLKLLSANKIYIQDGFNIKESFKKISIEVFQAQTENVEFSDTENAAKAINSWVEKQTNNRIKNLISPNMIDASTRLVLVNALYFFGNWIYPFGKKLRTAKQKFYTSTTSSVDVDMMHTENSFGYYECSKLNAEFIELPYKGGASMVIVLPSEIDGLKKVENNLDELLKPQNFSNEIITLSMPKWKTETKIDFNKILQNLGVKTIFTNSANLSGISDEPLKVSNVVQKAFINVTETGTEAAAATAVSVVKTLAVIELPKPKVVEVNHPFLYYIKYKKVILFIGRTLSP